MVPLHCSTRGRRPCAKVKQLRDNAGKHKKADPAPKGNATTTNNATSPPPPRRKQPSPSVSDHSEQVQSRGYVSLQVDSYGVQQSLQHWQQLQEDQLSNNPEHLTQQWPQPCEHGLVQIVAKLHLNSGQSEPQVMQQA